MVLNIYNNVNRSSKCLNKRVKVRELILTMSLNFYGMLNKSGRLKGN